MAKSNSQGTPPKRPSNRGPPLPVTPSRDALLAKNPGHPSRFDLDAIFAAGAHEAPDAGDGFDPIVDEDEDEDKDIADMRHPKKPVVREAEQRNVYTATGNNGERMVKLGSSKPKVITYGRSLGTNERRDSDRHSSNQGKGLLAQTTISSFKSFGSRSARNHPLWNAPNSAAGLRNLGNTCYMNASLQALLALQPFIHTVCDEINVGIMRSVNEEKLEESFLEQFFLLHQDWTRVQKRGGVVNPEKIKQLIGVANSRFNGWAQEDAHEFLSALLNELEDEYVAKNPEKATTGPVFQHFSTVLAHTLTCDECHETKKYEENYLDLSLELVWPSDEAMIRGVKLEYLLSHFLSKETDIEWNCPKCEPGKLASLEHQIARAPEILSLHVKRFVVNDSMTGFDKLVVPVLVPEFLDLAEFCNEKVTTSTKYRLVAAIHHHGETIRSGHFTCSAREKEQWRGYNDSVVKNISTNTAFAGELPSKRAYILFYERDDVEAKS